MPGRTQPKLFRQSQKPYLRIGHRGYPAVAPENTIASFEKAVEAGLDMIEFDVVLSKDHVPIVLHDKTLNRTTDGKGSPKHKTLTELKELDAGSWFSKEFAGEGLPTLSQVLEFAKGKVGLNLEIKAEASLLRIKGGVEERVVELLNDYQMAEYTVVSSFSAKVVARIKRLSPSQSVGFLISRVHSPRMLFKRLDRIGADALHINKQSVFRELIEKMHSMDRKVRVYTVDDLDEMKQLIGLGVDGIYSNRADLLMQL